MATKTTKFRALPTSDTPNVDREGPPEETDPDFMCGVFDYRPRWMQRFAKTGYFLVCFIVYGIFQGALKAYLNGCITTLEKKFGLTGRTFSVILIADNLSSLPACLLIGHFARKVSRPKLIAFAVWMSVLGCLLAALPYFIYGPGFVGGFHEQLGRGNDDADPLYSGARKEYCTREDGDESESDLDESPPTSAILAVCMFFIANFCNGFGGAAFYISGTTYTDDNAKKMDSIVYFSFIFSLRFLGPMLGYVMASVCLGIYESPLENPAISRKHPSWIGAWWLGFVIWGVSLAFMSVPMAFFPKQIRRNSLPVDKKVLQGKEAPLSATPDTLREKISRDLAEFGQSFARLCKNPVLMWKIAIITFAFNGIGGYVTMFPKYVEIHYRVSASNASLFTGPTKIVAMMFGIFLGGLVIRFLKPKPRTIGLMEAASDLVDIIALIAGMTLSCSGWQLAGTTTRSDGRLLLNVGNAARGNQEPDLKITLLMATQFIFGAWCETAPRCETAFGRLASFGDVTRRKQARRKRSQGRPRKHPTMKGCHSYGRRFTKTRRVSTIFSTPTMVWKRPSASVTRRSLRVCVVQRTAVRAKTTTRLSSLPRYRHRTRPKE
ncbi:solute carrier organic anion transporter family member 74D-like isoform X2 [Haemaphysalis longicornis]